MIMGGLNKLCKSFKVPDNYKKSSIEHNYTEHDWLENKPIWSPYLKRDISSLSYILMTLFNKLFSITKINPTKYISIASFSKKVVDGYAGF